MLDRKSLTDLQSFRALAIVMLILVALIMASAALRMRLYVDAYGLTQDRLYATAFMYWIGTVLGLLARTTLLRNSRQSAFGTIVSGFVLLAALNVLNPDALVARVNLACIETGRPLGVTYIGSLSTDGVPTIISRLSSLKHEDRCALLIDIDQRWRSHHADWRIWNLGRHRAVRSASRAVSLESARACVELSGQ